MDDEAHELIAGYALDALDADERRRVEELLERSPEARAELRSFGEATDALVVAASGVAPPPELRERVLAVARAEPRVVVPLEPQARRRALVPVLGAAAALAACVAIALGAWALSLSRDLDDSRASLADARSAAAVLGDPNARPVSLESGSGRLVVTPEGGAVLVTDGLGDAPPGKRYELWIMHGDQPVPAGSFDGGRSAIVPVTGEVGSGDVVAVTVEDAAGVDAPTSEPVLVSLPV